MSSPTPPAAAPERQALKVPDQANSAALTDDIAARRRALAVSSMTGALGLSTAPSTTTALGG